MATFERKTAYDNPSAIADKSGDLPAAGGKISAKRARKTCSDECYFDETDGEGHWYGSPDGKRQ
jgi:hypothetical protein